MPKTQNINLELTTDEQTKFIDWRRIMDGLGDGTQQSPYSNMQLIDLAVGDLINNKQDKLTAGAGITIIKSGNTTTISTDVIGIKYIVVQTLPVSGETGTIYLVPSTDPGQQNVYDEYIYVAQESKWELVGSTKVDFSDYYNKAAVDALLALKQGLLIEGRNITIDPNTNTISADATEVIPNEQTTGQEDILNELTIDGVKYRVAGVVNVDSELSLVSENPVQNKVITAALNDLGEALADIKKGELEHFTTPRGEYDVPYDGIKEVFDHLSKAEKEEIYNKCIVHNENAQAGEPEYEAHSFVMEAFDDNNSLWFFKGFVLGYGTNWVQIYRINLSVADGRKYINQLYKTGSGQYADYVVWSDDQKAASMNVAIAYATIRETLESLDSETVKKLIGEPQVLEEGQQAESGLSSLQDTLGRIYTFEATSENSADVHVFDTQKGYDEGPEFSGYFQYWTSVSIETDPETGDSRVVVGELIPEKPVPILNVLNDNREFIRDVIISASDNSFCDSLGRLYSFEPTSETTADISILDPTLGVWEGEESGLVGYSSFTSSVELETDAETGNWQLVFGEITPVVDPTITVDTQLDPNSYNPIANSPVAIALNNKQDEPGLNVDSQTTNIDYTFADNFDKTFSYSPISQNITLRIPADITHGTLSVVTFTNVQAEVTLNIVNGSSYPLRFINNNRIISTNNYIFGMTGRKIVFLRCDGQCAEVLLIEEIAY